MSIAFVFDTVLFLRHTSGLKAQNTDRYTTTVYPIISIVKFFCLCTQYYALSNPVPPKCPKRTEASTTRHEREDMGS